MIEQPKMNQRYWYIDSDGDVNEDIWVQDEADVQRYYLGNIYKTDEQCNKAIRIQEAKTMLLRAANFNPDWSNFDEEKVYVYYDHDKNQLDVYHATIDQPLNEICFSSEEAARKSIKEGAYEWHVLLGLENE